YTAGTLTIGKASLTVKADDKIKAYNTANPALTVSYLGLVNGDTPSGVELSAPTLSTTATTGSAAGAYPITVSGGSYSSNYTVSYSNGTLTVGSTTPTITFADMHKTYGDGDFDGGASSPSPVTITYSSDNLSVATIVSNKVHIIGAGTANITASQAGDSNYDAAAPVTKVLTVDKATLAVTADDQSRTYGTANPALTVSYSGFVNGDTATDLTTPPTA
ncbi:MBG domain-containing protein, partial [Rubrolithibacter danxiaensis]|uniref:MBG domain-containing protein n=1 Tax=Rubrolithibacter danxiaensis TaxID=3390805 RepID=UPI003BF84AC9